MDLTALFVFVGVDDFRQHFGPAYEDRLFADGDQVFHLTRRGMLRRDQPVLSIGRLGLP